MTAALTTLASIIPKGATIPDLLVFWVAFVVVILGACGVVFNTNPVHSALSLVLTLFGVAVLFVLQGANFLAAVQVIVYAGAIVVLFLFVIMFLGVDRQEDLRDPFRLQWPIAFVLVALAVVGLGALTIWAKWPTGPQSVAGPAANQPGGDTAALGRAVFTTYLFPFEVTAALLVIAVVGAVALARRPAHGSAADDEQDEALAAGDGAGPDGAGEPADPDDEIEPAAVDGPAERELEAEESRT